MVRALDGRPAVSRARAVAAVRTVLAERRRAVLAAASPTELDALALETPALLPRVRAALAAGPAWSLDRVINATGVVLHTNLGRAPLGPAALARLALVAARYSNLELDVRTKARGSRYDHVDGLLCRLSGAEASLVVNNNAAAVLLALESLARGPRGRRVAGRADRDRRRLPDPRHHGPVRRAPGRGGDHEPDAPQGLRERDHAGDGAPPQGASLELPGGGLHGERRDRGAGGARRARGLPVLEDLGSGSFLDLRPWGLPREPTVPETVAAGADVVTFSGDKLLGGPQAGIVVGRRALVERLQQNPLNRALRIDKLTLAALEATLWAYEDPATGAREIPTLRMLSESAAVVRRRAGRVLRRVPAPARAALGLTVESSRSEVGGGALPVAELPTAVLALGTPAHPAMTLDARLRAGRLPVIGRVADDRLLLDCRTVMDDEVPLLAAALTALA